MESGIQLNQILSSDGLRQSQLDNLNQYSNLNADSTKNLSDSDKQKLAQAARGFESMFINMVMKEMRTAMLDEDENKDGEGSFGADTLQSYAYMQLSDQFSKTGNGIGIAEKIYSAMTGGDKLSSISQIISQLTSDTAQTTPTKSTAQTASSTSTSEISKLAQNSTKLEINGNFIDKMNSRLDKYDNIIAAASEKYGVPAALIKSIITCESAGNAQARSAVGAKGLMQLMDGTAKSLGVKNSYEPYENIMGGTKYIRQMLDRFDNNVELALAGYNAGPGNVEKYNGIPPFSETQNYVRKVKRYYELFTESV